MFAKSRLYQGCKSAPEGVAQSDYRNLVICAHRLLAAPPVWCPDNLTIYLAPESAAFVWENKEGVAGRPDALHRPEFNPVEGIWSLLKRVMANFTAADLASLVRIVKRNLKKIRHRPHLIDGCQDRPDRRALVISRALRIQPGAKLLCARLHASIMIVERWSCTIPGVIEMPISEAREHLGEKAARPGSFNPDPVGAERQITHPDRLATVSPPNDMTLSLHSVATPERPLPMGHPPLPWSRP